MRITGDLRPVDVAQSLVVKEEPRAFNVLTGETDKPFLSCSFSDLSDIRTHFEIASRQFNNVLVHIAKPLDHGAISNLVRICSRAASLSIEIPESYLFRDYRDLFALLVPEEELRFLCVKGKKVGERDWHSV